MNHAFGNLGYFCSIIISISFWLMIWWTICVWSIFKISRAFLRWKTAQGHSSLWQSRHSHTKPIVVAFFHPYCNAGGGGERVLWCGIRALQRQYDFVNCIVYSGDTEYQPSQILARAKERFNIELERPIEFVFLTKRRWVEAEMWPHFTLLGQSIGSMLLGLEALWKFLPDVYIDTMGYAFTYPIFRFIGGCKIGCYVHYPTISTDMLMKVRTREASYNNSDVISKSALLTHAKLLYYKLFAFSYGLVGKCSSVIMVNSSWTKGHISEIWNKSGSTCIVYPPCDTSELLRIDSKSEESNVRNIISVGQFRPEKNHILQLKAFKRFLESQGDKGRDLYHLLLVGSCRNKGDEMRVVELKETCKDLGILSSVEFHLNVTFSKLKELLSVSTIGLHTMWNEHFGIGIVEFMAAGVIALAHDSGGPKLDIICRWKGMETGFHASDEDGYSEAMKRIFSMDKGERENMRKVARKSVHERFSEAIFEHEFVYNIKVILS